jgi:hypothetical protein
MPITRDPVDRNQGRVVATPEITRKEVEEKCADTQKKERSSSTLILLHFSEQSNSHFQQI